MRRREFITLLGGAAAAWPLAARAQQQQAMSVIGFLRSTPSAPFMHFVAAFQQGLKEEGFVEGQNVTIEYRWADNQLDRLPGLAAELVQRQVAVIVGNTPAALAAKAATTSVPIVFVTGTDPVRDGLVASLNRPSGNVTGVVFFASGHLGTKRMELLCEMVPKAAMIAVLMDPKFAAELPAVEGAGRALGRQILVVNAATEHELDDAFSQIVQAGAGALLVGGGPFFTSQRQRLVALAARHAIPAIYDARDHVEAGGLMSYGTSLTGAYRQAGIYAGHILKGAKPADLPVLQPTKFELVINLRTAKALGLTVPLIMQMTADEVIE
jgi:putative tryptophan/tyrosine transport system substrate-binding protein